MLSKRLVRCLWAAVIFIPLLHAQEAQWRSLGQVRPGTKIQVVENSLNSTTGKFVAFSETDLTLTVEGKQVVIPRERIHRVSIWGKNRKRNVLIGLAIGAGAGVGLGLAANQVVDDAKVVPLMGLTVGGVGAGIGAIAPANRTIYTAEAPKRTTAKDPTPGTEEAKNSY